MKKAVSVTSGGIDSITNGLMMLKRGFEVHYIHFNYRQKCELGEKLACIKIVEELKRRRGLPVILHMVDLPFFAEFGKGSALVDSEVKVPAGMESLLLSATNIGELWVPSRNVVFLAIASSLAERIGAEYITHGCNQSEIGYPDNTQEFLDRFTHMLEYGTIKIHPKCISPEYGMDKPHILKWGFDNGFGWVYKWTYSCDCKPYNVRFKYLLPLKREDILTCGVCGCSMNRRLAFLIAEKLWGIKDNQKYLNEHYFYETFLPEAIANSSEKFWYHKYLDLMKEVVSCG